MPLNVVLIAPEIPQNTGNIIRLCANTGAWLHLVEPLGFSLTDAHLRRASLDYRDIAKVLIHKSFDDVLQLPNMGSLYAATANGATPYHAVQYQSNDTVVFGSEDTGLPDSVLSALSPGNRIKIPMMPANRSLNLSNAVAIVVYEMWRQLEFAGGYGSVGKAQDYFS
jgi:tRNA (cytidine/uridine-2'-O-)-methyltransferase